MRTVVATLATSILMVALCGIAFIYSGAYYIGADQPHWAVTSWLFEQARTRSIRSHARDIAVPAGLDDPARIVAGVTHFAEHCVVCHGAPGVERGDIAEGLSPPRQIWRMLRSFILLLSCSGSSSTGSG